MRKPNIIFINTDQHTWDAFSALGNPWIETPQIDRIFSNGTYFSRSYTTDPVCTPARTSWISGLYTSENGGYFNDGAMHEEIPDLGQILNANGYNAYHTGKWHVLRDQRRSFNTLFYGDVEISAGGAEFYDPVTTRSALDFLDTYSDDKPFYLQIGYVNPHDICEYEHNWEEDKGIPSPLDLGLICEEELPPLPENFSYDERETLLQKVMRREPDPVIHSAILNGIRNWSEIQWRYFIWNYYRFIEKVDLEIGLVLDALEQSRYRDNTIVIFSVDHGEAHGRHKTFQKFALYEESIKVPMVIASLGVFPEIPKGITDDVHFISGVDLMPTVLDFAGIEAHAPVSGRSFRPLLAGEVQDEISKNWPQFAYVESNYWGRAIITERFKYITEYQPIEADTQMPPGPVHSQTGIEQLFDLGTDPWEKVNLAFDPEYADICRELKEQLQEFERGLCRRPITADCTRRIISNWSERIKNSPHNV